MFIYYIIENRGGNKKLIGGFEGGGNVDQPN